MMHKIKFCKFCESEGLYIHLPALQNEPPEHKIVCSKCDYETQTYKYSLAAMKEWNAKKEK